MSGTVTKSQKVELMKAVENRILVDNAVEMMSKMTEKCFKKCIHKPGKTLDATEQHCILHCMDRWMDSWNLVTHTYGNRLQSTNPPLKFRCNKFNSVV